jgi:hypothetical protein
VVVGRKFASGKEGDFVLVKLTPESESGMQTPFPWSTFVAVIFVGVVFVAGIIVLTRKRKAHKRK